eukprot:Skav200069  [mRNA]  locus=scaffold838:160589:161383:- [translate_table: standard]
MAQEGKPSPSNPGVKPERKRKAAAKSPPREKPKGQGSRGPPKGSTYRRAAEKEIKYYNSSEAPYLLLPKLSFARLTKEILCSIQAERVEPEPLRFSSEALEALQTGVEAFVSGLLADASHVASHAKRVTVFARDIRLVAALKGIEMSKPHKKARADPAQRRARAAAERAQASQPAEEAVSQPADGAHVPPADGALSQPADGAPGQPDGAPSQPDPLTQQEQLSQPAADGAASSSMEPSKPDEPAEPGEPDGLVEGAKDNVPDVS